MNILLTILLISNLIYAINAGECQMINQPGFLSYDKNSDGTTVSNFANNFATILGLSSDQNDKQEQPLFYSTRSLEIPATVWLFHVEGVDRLTNTGISLEDNRDFDIDSIYSKLRETGNGDALSTASILISSESDMNNLEKTIQNQISQMDNQASIKYIVIVCDECSTDKSLQQLQNQLKTIIDQIVAKDPQTLATILTTKESARVRRARQAEIVRENVTIATMYSDEYPVMFNLFFWTSLVFAIIIISIVYVFLTLDPGSDTIIYRMTAPRLKVD